jgi:5-methyltetrahydropteroyltriglutamate--homocysteine methyltransferase
VHCFSIRRRAAFTCIREASRFVPLERLAVSLQCGFSNSVIGNTITPADQQRKLRRVVETARRVWGEDTALLAP